TGEPTARSYGDCYDCRHNRAAEPGDFPRPGGKYWSEGPNGPFYMAQWSPCAHQDSDLWHVATSITSASAALAVCPVCEQVDQRASIPVLERIRPSATLR